MDRAVGAVALAMAMTGCLQEGPEVGAHHEALVALLPDIVEEIPNHLNLVNHQGREKLRFTSTHWNVGTGVLQIRGGGEIAPCELDGVQYEQCTFASQELLDANGDVVSSTPAGVAIFHPEHNHWHQGDVANFLLRDGSLDGPIVAEGVKVTYCLIDYDWSDLVENNNFCTSPTDTYCRRYFDCDAELQGISPGFGDEYHHSTHGQDLDVTGLPEGLYYLTHEVDATNKWIEADDTNNFSWTSFELIRKGQSVHVDEVDHSPCDEITCGNTSNR